VQASNTRNDKEYKCYDNVINDKEYVGFKKANDDEMGAIDLLHA